MMTLGKRMVLGFGVCVALTALVSAWGIYGVGKIVENGKQSILGNHLQSEMLQREVDHLNWANTVASRLAEDHPSGLDVQKDPTLCAFGKWYYGEGRKNAERDLPVLASLFSAMRNPIKGSMPRLPKSMACSGRAKASPRPWISTCTRQNRNWRKSKGCCGKWERQRKRIRFRIPRWFPPPVPHGQEWAALYCWRWWPGRASPGS